MLSHIPESNKKQTGYVPARSCRRGLFTFWGGSLLRKNYFKIFFFLKSTLTIIGTNLSAALLVPVIIL